MVITKKYGAISVIDTTCRYGGCCKWGGGGGGARRMETVMDRYQTQKSAPCTLQNVHKKKCVITSEHTSI